MPRGRQYYDPIVQVPGKVEGAQDLSRIELYPEGAPDDPNPKWRGRLISNDGSIVAVAPGDFDHDRALVQAQQLWPDLSVYELRSEGEDSTWEGHGPSPRLWQNSAPETDAGASLAVSAPSGGPSSEIPGSEAGAEVSPAVDLNPAGAEYHRDEFGAPQPTPEQMQLRLIPVNDPGAYVLLSDICDLLEMWAVSYEVSKNPSGAMALREAVDALKEIG